MNRTAAILNPAAGARLGATLRPLLERACPVELAITESEIDMDLAAWSREQVESGVERVIVAGGDDTVVPVAIGLAGSRTVLGIVPTGTFNNVATSLGIPSDAETAIRVALASPARAIAAGSAGGDLFIQGMGVGLEAELFPVAEALKAGHFTQVLDGAAALLRSQPATYEITFPPARRRIRSRALLLTVSNGPLIGARLKVAPQADLRRPELVMTLYGGIGRLRTAANFLGLFLRMRRVHPGARQLRFAKATISSPEALSVHLDGRPAGTLPVEVSVVPDALLVATP